jgi:uncharacterized membrane protein
MKEPEALLLALFLCGVSECDDCARPKGAEQQHVAFISARPGRATHPGYVLECDLLATAIGLVTWVLFAFYGHQWLIGVRPIG